MFNENKIPSTDRSRLLILCDNDGIVWLEGFGVAQRVAVSDASKKVLIILCQAQGGIKIEE